jgi:hypothetical protein
MRRSLCLLAVLSIVSLFGACGAGGGDSPEQPSVPLPDKPVITVEPSPATVEDGQRATFTVTAIGAGSLSYQWQFNNADIEGANNATYTTPVLDTGLSGSSYRVTVRNENGEAYSLWAPLTVERFAVDSLGDNQATAMALAAEAYASIVAAERREFAPGHPGVLAKLPSDPLWVPPTDPLWVPPPVPYSVKPWVYRWTVNFRPMPDLYPGYRGGSIFYCGSSRDSPKRAGWNRSGWIEGAPVTMNVYAWENCGRGYRDHGDYLEVFYNVSADRASFRWKATYDLSSTRPGDWSARYTGSRTCTVVNGVSSCMYFDGERTFDSGFTWSDGRMNGVYEWKLQDNDLNMSYSNWTTASGSLAVTGNSGFRASVARTGANTFAVTINGGASRLITFPR